ncbi:aldehyde dehydrogenase family protein, partial [Staphylococcus epidermidis]|uniref:aldehyde dehydrogenase family protein n=1 Tax=Staphylococcus epidermidis TaxID=1282 RepID=UPI00119E13A2
MQPYIQLPKKHPATIPIGRKPPQPQHLQPPLFFQPTLITHSHTSIPILQHQVFPPLLTLQPFPHQQQPIPLPNHSIYPLPPPIFTK